VRIARSALDRLISQRRTSLGKHLKEIPVSRRLLRPCQYRMSQSNSIGGTRDTREESRISRRSRSKLFYDMDLSEERNISCKIERVQRIERALFFYDCRLLGHFAERGKRILVSPTAASFPYKIVRRIERGLPSEV